MESDRNATTAPLCDRCLKRPPTQSEHTYDGWEMRVCDECAKSALPSDKRGRPGGEQGEGGDRG